MRYALCGAMVVFWEGKYIGLQLRPVRCLRFLSTAFHGVADVAPR